MRQSKIFPRKKARRRLASGSASSISPATNFCGKRKREIRANAVALARAARVSQRASPSVGMTTVSGRKGSAGRILHEPPPAHLQVLETIAGVEVEAGFWGHWPAS